MYSSGLLSLLSEFTVGFGRGPVLAHEGISDSVHLRSESEAGLVYQLCLSSESWFSRAANQGKIKTNVASLGQVAFPEGSKASGGSSETKLESLAI